MSHTAFGEFFREIADKETRVVTIIDQAIMGPPPGTYALIDLYCTDPDCLLAKSMMKRKSEGKMKYQLPAVNLIGSIAVILLVIYETTMKN